MTFNKAARFAQDRERERLASLDMQDGGDRLLKWTLATYQIEEADMARKTTQKAATTQAAQLYSALQFVSVAGTKDDADYKCHVVLNNHFAVACDGQITAGHPIAEELECCPHLKQLMTALQKCGSSLSIAELPTGQLSITGDKLSAKLPCVPFTNLPDSVLTTPDPQCAIIDDRIKEAFAVCGTAVSENGARAYQCGLLLEANACTGTDGIVLLQYWHGIDLPPGLFVPKIFAAAVCKIKAPLIGFGWTQGRSVTFYFDGGAWLKTLLYEDKYPDVTRAIDIPSTPNPVPQNLFEAIETVASFDENEAAELSNGVVKTNNAEYVVEGLNAECLYSGRYAKLIAPIAKTIDFNTYGDRALFFGDNVRGVVMGIKHRNERPPEPRNVETMADEIPF